MDESSKLKSVNNDTQNEEVHKPKIEEITWTYPMYPSYFSLCSISSAIFVSMALFGINTFAFLITIGLIIFHIMMLIGCCCKLGCNDTNTINEYETCGGIICSLHILNKFLAWIDALFIFILSPLSFIIFLLCQIFACCFGSKEEENNEDNKEETNENIYDTKWNHDEYEVNYKIKVTYIKITGDINWVIKRYLFIGVKMNTKGTNLMPIYVNPPGCIRIFEEFPILYFWITHFKLPNITITLNYTKLPVMESV